MPDSGLRRLIQEHVVVDRLEHTRVPLHVIATDVMCGDEVRLSEGSLEDAVMASAAIPGVLPAVEWGGRALIDGGVTNNAPLSHAVALGADRIFVLATGTPCELDEPPHGALGMLLYATQLLVGRRLAEETATIARDVELTILPPPCPLTVQPTDFSQAEVLIARARRDARRHLKARYSAPARLSAATSA